MTDEAIHEGIELRQRIVGALVLIGLSCLVLPLVFKHPVVKTISQYQTVASPATLPKKPTIIIPPKPSVVESAQEQKPAMIKPIVRTVPKPTAKKAVKLAKPMLAKKVVAKPKHIPKPIAKINPTPKSVPVIGWLIQAGSFSQHEHAKHLYTSLKRAGYHAHLQKKLVHHHSIWQVFVGPAKDEKAARKLQQQIDRKLKMKTILKRVHA